MELTFLDIAEILLKRIWIILLSTIVGFVASFIVTSYILTPKYTSTSELYVNPNSYRFEQAGTMTELQYAQKLVNSYLIILKNNVFLRDVAEKSNLNYSPQEIKNMLSLSSINNTEIFEVKVQAPSAQDAKVLVDTIVSLAPGEIMRIRELDTVKVVTPATLPSSPSYPNKPMNLMIGALIGFVVAAVGAVLVEVLDTRIKCEEDLTERYNYPILGSIPKYDV